MTNIFTKLLHFYIATKSIAIFSTKSNFCNSKFIFFATYYSIFYAYNSIFHVFFAQKLLTNNANYNIFILIFYEQYDYNANNKYDEKQMQTINENIKFEIFEHANFDNIIIFFHAKTFEFEIFNDKIYIRHDMFFMSCNICKQNYFNNDNRVRLNNYIIIIHEIDIKFDQFMNQKRYINWMKHAILHVIIIRESLSKREYVIIQTRLYDENNKNIFVCRRNFFLLIYAFKFDFESINRLIKNVVFS